jgi:3-(3-hydroxy-phenyl)propionate hydroxylase
MDDVAGTGLRLVSTVPVEGDAPGMRVIRLGAAAGPGIAVEADGILAAWFARHGVCAALVRPDHYVYGVAATAADVPGLIKAFQQSMGDTR